MTERWRRSLDALGRSEPEVGDLRERALRGPRLPDPPRRKASAFVAGALSLSLALASFSVLRSAFREEPDRPLVQTPSQAETSRLDPEEICDVPPYDPSVALLGDDSSSVFGATASREVPLELLEAPGASASSITGPATEALRSFLVDPQAVHAPSDGWRSIVDTPDEVIFAAPPDGGSDWWVTRFTLTDGAWTARESELVEQHQTAAQLGQGLSLMWGETTVVDDGVWGSTLHLNNDRGASWSSGEGGYELWGVAHVFDPETGGEVGHAARSVGGWGVESVLASDETVRLPLSLGGALSALESGREYDVVACVPELGLASPVGTLRVAEHPMASARVLTYPFEGASMLALGGGRLVIHDGCLAVAGRFPRPIYVLWPDGYSLVYRQQEEPVLIDPVGREVARLGETVTLGGGYVPLENAAPAAIGGIPAGCRTGGEGYFITSGPAEG